MIEYVLLTGYRGTGKDSLYKLYVNGGAFYLYNEDIFRNVKLKTDNIWAVYIHPNSVDFPLNYVDHPTIKRVAFADILKKETHQNLELPCPEDLRTYDQFKSRMIIDGKNL